MIQIKIHKLSLKPPLVIDDRVVVQPVKNNLTINLVQLGERIEIIREGWNSTNELSLFKLTRKKELRIWLSNAKLICNYDGRET